MKYSMIPFLVLLAAILAFGCAHQKQAKETQTSRTKPSFGVKFSTEIVRFAKPLANGADSGLKLEVVFPYFPASKAGMRTGDVLVGFENEIFKSLPDDYPQKFAAKLAQLKLGEKVTFHVLQSKDQGYYQINQGEKIPLSEGELPPLEKMEQQLNTEITATWKKTQVLQSFAVPVQTRNWSYGDQPISEFKISATDAKEDQLRKKVKNSLSTEAQKSDLKDLESRIEELSLFADEKRLPIVSSLQKNPYEISQFQNSIFEKARDCKKNPNPWNCLQNLSSAVGSFQSGKTSAALIAQKPEDFLKAVAKVIAESDQVFDSAFESLSSQERAYLKEHSVGLAKQLTQNIYLHENSDKYRLARDLKLMGLIQKVKIEKIYQSFVMLRAILNHETLASLQKLAQESKPQEIVAHIKTSQGILLIGGKGNNDYTQFAGQNVLFILDLGGHDYYPDVSANVIDLSGNDRYRSAKPWNFNSGFFRNRFLADLSGDDVYRCSTGCLASSMFGASLFIDYQGNDVYSSHSFSVGSSLSGISLFMDLQGNDLYESAIFSQGVGVAGGLALLMDHSGNDTYLSKEPNASSYGDPGQFDGWSQGVGIGLRNFVSGGWGFLYDGQGQDQFESGTFSQGGGYYFGIGSLINDDEQNDFYMGARYSQGFSAHYAAGTFLDVGGDDVYSSLSFVGQGMAWDLSLTIFQDRAGNDKYKTCEHCLGVGSQNSMAFFVDSAGEDTYLGLDLPYKAQRYNDYHGGKSLGLFWDQGKGDDKYQSFKNNHSQVAEGWQILVDD